MTSIWLAAALATAAPQASCAIADHDRRWTEQARAAWRHQLRSIPELRPPAQVTVLLFDRRCRLSSRDALARTGAVRWRSARHGGRIVIGDGTTIPVGVTSFAGEVVGGQTFVMALPSLWQGKVDGGPIGLPALTTAVMLHEASHVAQGAVMARVSALTREQRWPDSFNDDSIQERFEKEPAFAAAMDNETKLLFAAARASDDGEARRLASEALASTQRRRARWFTGKDQALGRAEDLFLTLEGSGQYVGYDWLISATGGRMPKELAMKGWGQRGRWWSQRQGLALMLAVERLRLAGWREQVWGTPKRVGLELLQAALATPDPLAR